MNGCLPFVCLSKFCAWIIAFCTSHLVFVKTSLLSSSTGTFWVGAGMTVLGLLPISSSKGDCFVTSCGQVLCMNCAMGRCSTQLFCNPLPKILRYCSTHWFIHSASPSVCGWYALLRFCLICSILQSSLVNMFVNLMSQSEMMRHGSP